MKTSLNTINVGHLRGPIWAALFLLAGSVWGQTNTAKRPADGNRYLLIVETSRAMERRLPGVLQTVQNVLGADLAKELRGGDSIGVWTYNETLNTGRMPLQRWSPGAQNVTIALITNLVAHEKYHKQGHPEKVLPTLGSVVTGSPVITVILIASGSADISGTPFDDQINATFKQWRDQQQTKRMPFVVVFRAADGKMTACAAGPAPWPMQLPPLPQREPKILAAQSAVPTNAVVKKARVLPPLIVSGKKLPMVQTNAVAERVTTNQVVAAVAPSTAGSSPVETARPEANVATLSSGRENGTMQEASAVIPAVPLQPTAAPAGTNFSSTAAETVASASHPEQSAPSAVAASKDPAATSLDAPRTGADPAVATAEPNPNPGTEVKPVAGSPRIGSEVAGTHWLWSLLLLVLGALGFAAAVAGWSYWQRGRRRVHRPISLITRSLEQKG